MGIGDRRSRSRSPEKYRSVGMLNRTPSAPSGSRPTGTPWSPSEGPVAVPCFREMQAHAQERRRKEAAKAAAKEAADEAAKAAAEEAAKEAAKALHKKSKAAKESSQNSRLRSKRAEADVQLPEGSSRLSALSRSLSRKGSQKKKEVKYPAASSTMTTRKTSDGTPKRSFDMTTATRFSKSQGAEDELEAAREEERRKKRNLTPLKLVPEGFEDAIPTQRQLIEDKREARLQNMMYKAQAASPAKAKGSKLGGLKLMGLGTHVFTSSADNSGPKSPFGSKPSLESYGYASPSRRRSSIESLMPSSPFHRKGNRSSLTPTKEENFADSPEEDTPSKAARVLGMNGRTANKAGAKMLDDDTPPKAVKLLGADKGRALEQDHNPATTKRRNRDSYSGANEQSVSSRRHKFLEKPARALKNMTSFANKTVNTVTGPAGRSTAMPVDTLAGSSRVKPSGNSSLVRSQSLKYIDDAAPPTPPEKDSLPPTLRRAGRQVRRQDTSGQGDVFGDNAVINDTDRSPTRNGGHGRRATVNVTHQEPDMYASMRGIIEGESRPSSAMIDDTASFYPDTDGDSVEEMVREVASRETDAPEKAILHQPQHRRHSRIAAYLQPAFFSPRFFRSPPEQNFKPSANLDPMIYTLPKSGPKPGIPGPSDRRTTQEARRREARPMEGSRSQTKSNTKTAKSSIANSVEDEELTPMMENMLNSPSKKNHRTSYNKLFSRSVSSSSQYSDDRSIRGNAFYPPGKAPAPLRRVSTTSQTTSALVPPEDLITHFDVLNRHLLDSTREVQDTVNTESLILTDELRRTHMESVTMLSEQFADVLAHVNSLEQNVGRIAGEVEQVKAEILKKLEALGNTIQTDLIRRLDEALFANAELSKKIATLAAQFASVEDKQQQIIEYLSQRNATWVQPYTVSYPNLDRMMGNPGSMSNLHVAMGAGGNSVFSPPSDNVSPSYNPANGHRANVNFASQQSPFTGHTNTHTPQQFWGGARLPANWQSNISASETGRTYTAGQDYVPVHPLLRNQGPSRGSANSSASATQNHGSSQNTQDRNQNRSGTPDRAS